MDRAHLRGRLAQTDVIRAVAEHDVFIQSSYGFDTQSMVLLESIAAGTPVILSDSDLVESLPNGAGIVTKTPDEQGLYDAISDLLSNPQKLARMRTIM